MTPANTVEFVDVYSSAYAEPDGDSTESRLYTKAAMDDNGFLRGRSVVTNIGVFSYRWGDGSIKRVLRHPDDVFAPASLVSLGCKPITDDHPVTQKVTPENYKSLATGSVGSAVENDGYHVYVDWVLTDASAIKKAQEGKRAWSCGYSASIVDESGTWLGVDYDLRQKDIRYNHLALVSVGRAGDAAKILMDSAVLGDVVIELGQALNDTPNKEILMDTISVMVDGASYTVDKAFAKAYQNAVKGLHDKAEELNTKDALLQAKSKEFDALKGASDAKDAEITRLGTALEDAKRVSPDVLNAAVAAKIALDEAAKLAGVAVTVDMSPRAIKEAVIASRAPELAARLRDANDLYVDGCFDFVRASLVDASKTSAAMRMSTSESIPAAAKPTETLEDARALYEAALAKTKSYYLGNDKKGDK